VLIHCRVNPNGAL